MKDLRAWLDWAVNETHVPAEERAGRGEAICDECSSAIISDASGYMVSMLAECRETTTADVAYCLANHPAAFRTLCLAFAEAVEKMREAVPEAPAMVEPQVEAWYRPAAAGDDLTGFAKLQVQAKDARDARNAQLLERYLNTEMPVRLAPILAEQNRVLREIDEAARKHWNKPLFLGRADITGDITEEPYRIEVKPVERPPCSHSSMCYCTNCEPLLREPDGGVSSYNGGRSAEADPKNLWHVWRGHNTLCAVDAPHTIGFEWLKRHPEHAGRVTCQHCARIAAEALG